MSKGYGRAVTLALGAFVWIAACSPSPQTEPPAETSTPATTETAKPVDSSSTLPNPYQTVENWAQMPPGRVWGQTSAVDIDPDGRSIWVGERCGDVRCLGSKLDPILKFDESGKLVRSFGAGMVVWPHGIHVDTQGNVWLTDAQDNFPKPDPKAPAGTPVPPAPAKPMGHQVFKFSPEGKLLMTLGKPGGNRPGTPPERDSFYEPNDVHVAPNGDIFVVEGHAPGPTTHARIVKFTSDGKYIKEWGSKGSAQGQTDVPHALAMDSKGRLFVGDRSNDRIQIFDQEGTFLAEWRQFSRPSGLYIDKADMLYVVDSDSEVGTNNPGWKRGLRVGRATDGQVLYFVADPVEKATTTSAAEGVVADAQGVIYGAEVGPRALKRYVKK